MVLLCLSCCASVRSFAADTPPTPGEIWNLQELYETPSATWGEVNEKTVKDETGKEVRVQTQKVWYESGPWHGKKTRVMGFYSRPVGEAVYPGMILVHGGGGSAYSRWTELWAARGYAALAMDLAGCEITSEESTEGDQPVVRLPDGGPNQISEFKFLNFSPDDQGYVESWTWQAVASILRAHSLLDSLPEVDPNRTGITGISWGGYLTSLVAGVDDRLQVAVPVYGCGNLARLSVWTGAELAKKTPEEVALWTKYLDPISYVGHARCRMLFVDGTDDFAYPLEINRDTWEQVPGADVCLILHFPHSHGWGWTPPEIAAYVNSVLMPNCETIPCLTNFRYEASVDGIVFRAENKYKVPLQKTVLYYTTDPGGFGEDNKWQVREWSTVDGEVQGDEITVQLPADVTARPVYVFLQAVDERGLRGSTHYLKIE